MFYIDSLLTTFDTTLTLGEVDTENPPTLALVFLRKGTNEEITYDVPSGDVTTGERYITIADIPTSIFTGTGQYDYSVYSTTPISFTDWYLPSKDELNQMYVNLHLFGVGNFVATGASDFYWSSSELNNITGWGHNFFNNNVTDVNKSGTVYVRACRSFTAAVGAYALRDTGPAGGLVFWTDGAGNYLESAPSDQSAGYIWSNIDGTLIGTTGTAIGTGQANTTAIINQVGFTDGSAKLCDDLSVITGYTIAELIEKGLCIVTTTAITKTTYGTDKERGEYKGHL